MSEEQYAFPRPEYAGSKERSGMTKREYFALMIYQSKKDTSDEVIARLQMEDAVKKADMLLKALEKK
jgi:hypothetical protein